MQIHGIYGSTFDVLDASCALTYALWELHNNDLRNTYTTRLLYTLLPSENYAPKGASLDALMRELVTDCNSLSTTGIDVSKLFFGYYFCNLSCATEVYSLSNLLWFCFLWGYMEGINLHVLRPVLRLQGWLAIFKICIFALERVHIGKGVPHLSIHCALMNLYQLCRDCFYISLRFWGYSFENKPLTHMIL